MIELQKEIPFQLCAVHVNHNIRGNEANSDEEFCKKLCFEKGIELFCFSVFVPEEAEKSGEGLEETARKLRYSVFEKLKKEEHIDYFLTAHHKNDSCETVVFNILRGCGVSGITGIPAVRGFYLRPLINCEREEIIEYLKIKNQMYVTDSTNSDEAYTRNYIRHRLLPEFARVNKGYLSSIMRLSENASVDEDYFSLMVDKIKEDDDLSALHPAISKRVIAKRYRELVYGEGLSMVHIKQIMACLNSTEEKRVNVPFGYVAIIKNGRVAFKGNEEKKQFFAEIKTGVNTLENGVSVLVEEKYIKIIKFSDNPLQITLTSDKIKGKLYARSRRDGDKIVCRGFTRSISKELMNLKVPKHIRDIIPVICDDEGIVFVPYVGADDRAFKKGVIESPLALTIQLNTKGNI
jgi:tRNA(Ile)-lysidine synthase